MTKVRSGTSDTQTRLLASACEVFAQKGYRDATIAEICERAGANVAAVNYYFRNKETLYAEAWRVAFQRSIKAHPPDGGVPLGAPAEERLRGRVLSVMQRMVDPKSHEFDIFHKEHANPTGLLAEVMRESIQPLRRQLTLIVRDLLGPRASEQQVELCQMSIMAQCFHILIRERHRKMFPGAGSVPPAMCLDLSVEVMADHVVRFSLAGIRELRSQIESGDFAEGQ